MADWTRRDLLKGGLAAWLGAWLPLPALRRSGHAADAAAGVGTRASDGASAAVEAAPAGAIEPGVARPGHAPALPLPGAAAAGRERRSLDFGWHFSLGHADDPARDFGYGRLSGEGEFAKSGDMFERGPSRADFDVSGWDAIDLPHDWAVRLPFVDNRELVGHGAKPLGRAFPETSIGWYRHVFHVPERDLGRRLCLQFDGVFRDSMVALNGFLLGRHASGYTPFRYDITDFANYGGDNVLVVRADATEYEGWFYEGAGIYRHVWLEKTAPVHVAHDGAFVSSTVHGRDATLELGVEVDNDGDDPGVCRVVCSVLDDAGDVVVSTRSVPVTVPARARSHVTQQLTLHAPKLWSPDAPTLYSCVVDVEVGGAIVDRLETSFGIRTIHHDPDRGLFLNGEHVEVKGTCNHQDHAGVGSALPDALQSYRVRRLKAMGCNAYRTSHNPPTPELLDACDRLGMLVMDETRTFSSDPGALADLETLVRRDRNHPSVIWWSIGNEEPAQGSPRGGRIADTMKRRILALDATRPVTMAMNNGWGKGASHVVDVQGFNYGHGPDFDAFHRRFPGQPSFGSETASTVATRGIYANDRVRGYVSAYDVNHPPWGATAETWWTTCAERPFLAGGFAWTGFDYRGEPTPYGWPCISSHFGIMDTCGFAKDDFYYYQAWWGEKPVLHLFPHWSWSGRDGQPIQVWCHTNLDSVELFLNGRSLGRRDVARHSHAQWTVAYAPGTLEAVGYRAGRRVLRARRQTTGPATAIRLSPDRTALVADRRDCAVVSASVVDAHGRVVPTADDLVSFTVTGPGRVIGVGNGDPSSHEPDIATCRHAFNGLCMAIVQAADRAGRIHVRAAAPGLKPDSAEVTAGLRERGAGRRRRPV